MTPPTKVEEPEVEEEELEGEELLEGEEAPEGEGEGETEGEGESSADEESGRGLGPSHAPLSSGRARPRRSTCWSRVSETRAANTLGPATTSASWSATSSPGATRARTVRSSPASSQSFASTASRVALLKPQTFMNESGRSVGAAARFFKVPLEQLLVVHDEVDLELGRLQARMGGGLAGHNGLRSVAQHLGDSGVHAPPDRRGAAGAGRPAACRGLGADARFRRDVDVGNLVTRAADAVETIARDGLEEAQLRFNERP